MTSLCVEPRILLAALALLSVTTRWCSVASTVSNLDVAMEGIAAEVVQAATKSTVTLEHFFLVTIPFTAPKPNYTRDPAVKCTLPPPEENSAKSFLSGTGRVFGNGVIGSTTVGLTSTGSTGVATHVLNILKTFPAASEATKGITGFKSGGHGVGYGFEVFCGTKLLLSFGSGGGGGVDANGMGLLEAAEAVRLVPLS